MADNTIAIKLAVDGEGNVTGAMNRVTESMGRMGAESHSVGGRMSKMFTDIASGVVVGNLVTQGIEKIIKSLDDLKSKIEESAKYAARVETLGVAMNVVGNNAGYTSGQMSDFEKQVKGMGITTEASREALVKMSASQMDLAKSSQLARVAQDAAVVGNINSSEAFGRMIQGIRSGETEILRNIGISVQFEQGYKKMAEQLGKTTDALTDQEKTQSRVNQVLAEGAKMQGIYEEAMGTTGKQLTSLSRYTDELKLAFGEAFAPALGVLVEETTNKLKALLKHFEDNRGAYKEFAANLAGIVRAAAHPIDSLSKAIYGAFSDENNPVAERNAIEAENRRKTEAADKEFAAAKERQRIRLGNEARANAARQAEAAAAAKAAEAEINSYNQFAVAFNDKIRAIEDSDPTITKHEQQLAKLRAEEEKMIEAYPKEEAEIRQLYAWIVQTTQGRQDYADSVAATSAEFKAMFAIWDQQPPAPDLIIGRSGEELKAELDLSRLNLETMLSRIDAQEKFNQITTGSAASQRISILEEQLKLETDVYNKIREEGAVGDLARAKQLESIRKINNILTEQKKILADSTFLGGAKAALEEYARMASDIGSQTKSVVADFLKGMEDALYNFVRNGKLSFSSLVDSIVNDIARIAVRQGVIGPLSNWLSGLLTSAIATTGAAGVGPTIANAGGLLGGTSAGGLASLLGGAVSKGAAAGTQAGATAGISASLPMLGAIIAGGMGAYQFGSSFFGQGGLWNNSTSSQKLMRGATYGTAASAALLYGGAAAANAGLLGYSGAALTMAGATSWIPVAGQIIAIGAGLAAITDKLTGGGLFGTNWKSSGSGISLGVDNGQISGQWWEEQKKKKAFFGGTSTRTFYKDVDSATQEYLFGLFSGVSGNIKAGAGYLGGSGSLANFSYAAQRLSLSGLNAEDQQKIIQQYFSDLSDAAIKSLYPEIEVFAKLGESATATFERLSISAAAVNRWFIQLDLALNDVSLAGAAASDALVQAFGGLQAAQSAMGNYLKSGLFNEFEQAQMKLTLAQYDLKKTFAELGLAIPTTAAGFKQLVNLYLEQGEAGAKTAAALIQVADAMALVVDAAGEGLGAVSTAIDTALSAAQAIKEIQGSGLTTDTISEQYIRAKTAFINSTDAQAGETAKAFLALSRQMYASGPTYAADYRQAMSRLGSLAGTTDTSNIDSQVNLLTQIKDALTKSDSSLIRALTGQLTGYPGAVAGNYFAGDIVQQTNNAAIPEIRYLLRNWATENTGLITDAVLGNGTMSAAGINTLNAIETAFGFSHLADSKVDTGDVVWAMHAGSGLIAVPSGDLAQILATLKEQLGKTDAQTTVLVSGLTELVDVNKSQDSKLKTIESTGTLAEAA